MAQIQFDASQVAPQQPMEALPSGWYKVALVESSMEPTGDGTGAFLKTEYSILEGKFKGRKIFDRLNLQNKNPQAAEIAQQALSALCHATGVIRITDSIQLHNIPFFLKVKIDPKRTEDSLKNQVNPATKQPYNEGDPGTKTYEAQNRINGYKNINDMPPGYESNGAPGTAPAGVVGAPAPSWATAKAPTAAPAQAAAPAAPATTSNAVPPFMQKVAEAAAAPAEAAKPKGPKGPKAKVAAPAAEPKFYVYFADDNMPVKTLSQIQADLKAGMPPDTQVLPEDQIKADDPQWKDASALFTAAEPAAQASAPATDVPPWERK